MQKLDQLACIGILLVCSCVRRGLSDEMVNRLNMESLDTDFYGCVFKINSLQHVVCSEGLSDVTLFIERDKNNPNFDLY